jgi:hypothetical protein
LRGLVADQAIRTGWQAIVVQRPTELIDGAEEKTGVPDAGSRVGLVSILHGGSATVFDDATALHAGVLLADVQ